MEQNTWRFDNFTTAELPWERYRDTFIGVPPDRDPWSSAFDVVFYDNLYKTELAKEGNCYGMALTALLLFKYEGHQGFCAPAYQYTESSVADPNAPLTLLINQMHGHQVNLPSLRLLLDIIASSKNRDGNYAYDQVNYYWSQDDPTLVSITKSLNPSDGGHTLIAYAAQPFLGQKRIFVYDPNRPWNTDRRVLPVEPERDHDRRGRQLAVRDGREPCRKCGPAPRRAGATSPSRRSRSRGRRPGCRPRSVSTRWR